MSRVKKSVYLLLLWPVFGWSWSAGADSNQVGQAPRAQGAVISGGARRLAPGDFGWTELMDAAVNGDLAKVQGLLAKGADVDARDNSGRTALMTAANVQIAQALIARGADVNAKNSRGMTALSDAVISNRADVAKFLLDRGADPNVNGSLGPVLVDASVRGQVTIVRALLEKGADPNVKDSTGNTPLIHAAEHRYAAVVEALLDKGADPNGKDRYGQTPLVLAAERGDEAAVRALLRKHADPRVTARFSPMGGTNADTALKRAAAGGHTATVLALLDSGADINARGESGDTALMIAARAGEKDVVRLLLDKGADTEARDPAGRSALSIAQGAGKRDVVPLLLAKAAANASKEKRGQALLLYFQAGGNQCALSSWNPADRSTKVLLNLPECPDEVFFVEEARTLIAVNGGTIQAIPLKPTVNPKTPISAPRADKIMLAGNLPDGRLAVVLEKVGPADDSELSLFGFDRGKWDLVANKNCGRFFTIETCLKAHLKGRPWYEWGEDAQVWHPKLALNPFVVSRGVAMREGERFVLDKRGGSPDEDNWGYVKFLANNRRSVLLYESRMVQGDAEEATVTFALRLQTYKDSEPVSLAEGQVNTAVEDKYLLIGVRSIQRLIDLETGEETIKRLQFAFWTH